MSDHVPLVIMEVLLSLYHQCVEHYAKPIADQRAFALGWALGKGQTPTDAEEFADLVIGLRRLL